MTTTNSNLIITFFILLISLTGYSQTVYVGTYWNGDIVSIDINNSNSIGNISTESSSFGLTLSNDETKLYATSYGMPNGKLELIDRMTNTVIESVDVGSNPADCVLNEDESKIYVANTLSNNVTVLNAENLSILSEIPTGEYAQELLLTGGYLYVGNAISQNISVIDTNTDSVIETIDQTGPIFDMALSIDGQTIFLTTSDGKLKYLDAGTNTITNTFTLGESLNEAAPHPDGSTLYISSQNVFYIFDLNLGTAETIVLDENAFIEPRSRGIALTEDGTKAYIADDLNDVVYVFDTESNTVESTIDVIESPVSLIIGKDLLASSIHNQKDKFVDISVYPNPVHDNLTISFANPLSQSANYRIYSPSGQLVKEGSIARNARTMDMTCSHLPSGCYTLFIEAKEWNFSSKLYLSVD